MTRFVFYTDVHLAARNPLHRIDDYSSSILDKVYQVYKLSEDLDANFIIFGGDFYNSHMVFSFRLITQAIKTVCGFNIPTHCIVGQHDLYGYNPSTYPSSSLAFQENHCEYFKTLQAPFETEDSIIVPCHVYDDLDEKLAAIPDKGEKKLILVAHKLISKDAQPFKIICSSDIKSNYDLVLSGDLHCGFPVHTVNNTIFANPGALARITTRDIKRSPQVVVVTIKGTPLKLFVEYVPLTCQKGFDVFDPESIEDSIVKQADVPSFIEEIESLQLESMDIFDLVDKLSAQRNIRKEVRDYILSKKPQIGR